MEPAERAEIEAFISENNVSEVSKALEENPALLLENKKLIKKARTPSMVETLLQFSLLTSIMDSGKPGKGDVITDNDCERRDIILRAIKVTFSTVLRRWPKLAIDVMDKHVTYRGYCAEDPELQVEVDFSLLTGSELSKNYCCSLSKPKHLLHLSSLNVNNSDTKEILLHPVVLTYLHLNTGFEWATFFLKQGMLLCGMMTSVTFVFMDTLPDFCPGENVQSLLERRGFKIAVFGASIGYLLSLIHLVIEMFKFLVLGRHYIGGLMFQIYLTFSLALVAMQIDGWEYLFLINFNLALLFNFLVCLSSAAFCGKYILVSIGILRTMLKVILPVILVLMALAATEFVLRYDEVLTGVFTRIQEAQETESARNRSMVEACAVTAPFSGDLGVAEVIFYLKSFFHVLNVMHGQTDTSDLTLFYEDLREQSSVMDSSYAVYWVVSTSFTTIILMNLLVGLTIGDIDEISENADCQIVQIKLRKLYLRCVWASFIKCLLCNFCQVRKSERIYTILYPNRYKGGCTVRARKDPIAKISSKLSTTYIIGCSKVRKSVLNHFK